MVSLAEFPESTLTSPGMKVLPADLTPRRPIAALLGVPYATKSGQELHLQIILPPMPPLEPPDFLPAARYPLVVYVQGSAWLKQELGLSLPGLVEVARRGYVVAIVEYRPSTVAPFPAQVRDVATAIRFLRREAGRFGIDVSRIALWGDSSGGHTTLLTYLTEGDQGFSDEPLDQAEPLGIGCFVDYYGPTDIGRMQEEPSIQDHGGADSPEGLLIGGVVLAEHPELVAPTVALNHLRAGQALKPLLMIHGSKDRIVPFGQSVRLHQALVAAGQLVEFYQLAGADHGGAPFWTDQVLDLVDEFIRRHLG
jgi:acetyl esterase/lipase